MLYNDSSGTLDKGHIYPRSQRLSCFPVLTKHKMVDAAIWDQEIAVPEDVISFVDNNVFASKLVSPAVSLPPTFNWSKTKKSP